MEKHCSVCGALLMFDEKDCGKCSACQIREKDSQLAALRERAEAAIKRGQELEGKLRRQKDEISRYREEIILRKQINKNICEMRDALSARAERAERERDEAKLALSMDLSYVVKAERDALRAEVERLKSDSDAFNHLCKRLQKHWPEQTKEFGSHVDDLVTEVARCNQAISDLSSYNSRLEAENYHLRGELKEIAEIVRGSPCQWCAKVRHKIEGRSALAGEGK